MTSPVLKWCESDIPLRTVLSLTPHAPLYGNKNPKRAGTHWVVWVKGIDGRSGEAGKEAPHA